MLRAPAGDLFMNALTKIGQLSFIPRSTDLALLLLRLWFAIPLLWFHGWVKVQGYSSMSKAFPDPLGVGSQVSLSLAIFAEVLCSVLVVLGLFTRFAAASLSITMIVAFFLVHKMVFTGSASGELAFTYLGAFLTLLIAGPGRYSLDARMGGGGSSKPKSKPSRD